MVQNENSTVSDGNHVLGRRTVFYHRAISYFVLDFWRVLEIMFMDYDGHVIQYRRYNIRIPTERLIWYEFIQMRKNRVMS